MVPSLSRAARAVASWAGQPRKPLNDDANLWQYVLFASALTVVAVGGGLSLVVAHASAWQVLIGVGATVLGSLGAAGVLVHLVRPVNVSGARRRGNQPR